MDDCIFCKLSLKEIDIDFLYENDSFFVIKDKNPVIEGHSLVISKKHFKTTLDLPISMGGEFLDAVKKTFEILVKSNKSVGGFNLINNNFEIGGQEVPHVHYHIIPRKEGDGFKIF